MKKCSVLFFLTAAAVLSAQNIRINIVSDPVLPAENLLSKIDNINFEQDLKGWYAKDKTQFQVVTDADHPGKVLKVSPGKEKLRRGAFKEAGLRIGHTYIASCMIRPDAKVNSTYTAFSGLGFTLTCWSKDWKKGIGINAWGSGPNQWQRIAGKPVKLPEWVAFGSIFMGVNYSQGGGLIADLCIMEAFADMTFTVQSPSAPVRQVKVVDNTGRTVYNSGILKGDSKEFKKTIQVETPYVYTVLAVDNDGDVSSVKYPASEKKQESGR